MKLCALCKDKFNSLSHRAQFCSKKCKNKQWYVDNKKYKNDYGKQYYNENKEIIDIRHKENAYKYKDYQQEANKQWRIDNIGYQNKYTKLRKKSDINFKLRCGLRTRLNSAIRDNYKTGSAVSDLGCSIEELKIHLETQFLDGMTWDNWTRNGWHIDHIKALANFDLTIKLEFNKAVHYTNLQPMWAKDNLSKGSKK